MRAIAIVATATAMLAAFAFGFVFISIEGDQSYSIPPSLSAVLFLQVVLLAATATCMAVLSVVPKRWLVVGLPLISAGLLWLLTFWGDPLWWYVGYDNNATFWALAAMLSERLLTALSLVALGVVVATRSPKGGGPEDTAKRDPDSRPTQP